MRFGLATASIRQYSDIVGFSAHWVWIWCVFWSSLFYDAIPASLRVTSGVLVNANLEPLWAFSLGSNVFAIGVLLLISRACNPLARIRQLPWIAGSLTCIGTLLLAQPIVETLGDFGAASYVMGTLLTGVGSGVVVVLWAETLARLGSKLTINLSVWALLLAAVGYAVLSFLPTHVAQVLVAALPVVSMVFYRRFQRELPHVPRSQRNVRVSMRPPVRMILIALFFGLSFGAMKGLLTPASSDLIGLRDVLNIVAIVIGVIGVYAMANIFRMDFDQLTYQVALPLMALGFLFLPLQEPASAIGTAIHQCGYQYFYIVLWSTWSVLATRAEAPVAWVVSWGMFSVQLGQLIGSYASAFAVGVITDKLGMAMLSGAVVFAMLLIALFVFGNRTATTGWGSIRPAEVGIPSSDFDEAATQTARHFKLSPRESEVFLLLAKGRNRAYIANKLAVGDETVKSHIKSLYRKLGVHSQQELIDLVDTGTKEEPSREPVAKAD